MVRRVGDYLLGNTLGEGTFGKVKFATHSKTGTKVAIKVLDKEKILKRRMQEQIMREIAIMKKLKHRNIVELKEVLHSKRNIYIVLDLCTGGELFDRIVESPLRRFEEDQARKYFQQLIDGISYCHANDVAHRDLKPENLLLDEEGILKISDFGLSAMVTTTALETPCGTPNYVAPEVLSHHGYEGRTADIWSCGVVLYVMLAGMLPFDEANDALLFDKIKKGQHRGYPTWFSTSVKSLLDKILVPDPSRRISIAQIESDSWFLVGYQRAPSGPKFIREVTEGDLASIHGNIVDDEGSGDAPVALDVGPVGMDVFTLISMLDTLSVSQMLQHRGTDSVKRRTCFIVPVDTGSAFDVLSRILSELPGCTVVGKKPDLKIRCMSARTAYQVQIYKLTNVTTVIEFNRRKGDTLEFHRVYNMVSDKCMTECKSKAPSTS